MRTTLTLDEDVAERLDQEVRRRGASFKSVVNDALRSGLAMSGKPRRGKPFKVEARALRMRAGIDPNKLNQLLDELDVEAYVARTGKSAK